MGAENGGTDLSALEGIADDFLTWRRQMILPGISFLALCGGILWYFHFAHPFDGKMYFIPGVVAWFLIMTSWDRLKKSVDDRITSRVLPLLSKSIGLRYLKFRTSARMRIQETSELGLFVAKNIELGHCLGLDDPTKPKHVLVHMDQFHTWCQSRSSRIIDFSGFLISLQAPEYLSDQVVKQTRTAFRRDTYDPFEPIFPPGKRHRREVRITEQSQNFIISQPNGFKNTERGLDIVQTMMTRTCAVLHEGSKLHGLAVHHGILYIAISRETQHFQLNPLRANKLSLLKTFSKWIEICALPLKMAEIWHGDVSATPNTRPEDTPAV